MRISFSSNERVGRIDIDAGAGGHHAGALAGAAQGGPPVVAAAGQEQDAHGLAAAAHGEDLEDLVDLVGAGLGVVDGQEQRVFAGGEHAVVGWLLERGVGEESAGPPTGHGVAGSGLAQAVHQLGHQAGLADAGDLGDGGDIRGAARTAPGFERVELGGHAGQRHDGRARVEQVGGGQPGVGNAVEQDAQVGGLQLGRHTGHSGDRVGESGRGEQAGGGHQMEQAGRRNNRRMDETFVDLGFVTAPSSVLVLGMAGWIDYWRELGQPLSERARTLAASGGGHLLEWLCEAVAVPAADDQPLRVRATTSPSPFDDEPTIAMLEVDLGLPWPETADRSMLIRLGDLPVDRCGMVLGDASGLDAWTGMNSEPAEGLADVTYWGRYKDDAHAQFGGERIARYGHDGPHGWLDMPLAEAQALAAELTTWRGGLQGKGVAVSLDTHTDFYRFRRAGWHHPLHLGAIEIGGCQVLGIDWDQGDHSMRHRGERLAGQVYPVTLEADEARHAVMRWTIPPYDFDGEDE
ncbi:hypothetical protein OG762_46855 (plasmid) [Streptomyces sp. NBC_01136]|uniref:hypothetical protein n=1 Tax=Streptomyces sp. NBC_01136 TaxID=2903754 RepID=UPI00386FAF71|nr:hypothetical protein OG762_46855 [Streptomyces sp. NBC_01136]